MLKKITLTFFVTLGTLVFSTLAIADEEITKLLQKMNQEKQFFKGKKNSHVNYVDPKNRKKIAQALEDKLNYFAGIKYEFKPGVEPLPDNHTQLQYLKYVQEKYQYLWDYGNYEEATEFIFNFFSKKFREDFKLAKFKRKKKEKSIFMDLLTIYAKHYFYGLTNRAHFKGEKSMHLEAYIMFQLAAENGSGEAYFYLSMMQ